MINDKIGPYFPTKNGLRHEEPLSPVMFNIVVDALIFSGYVT